MFKQLLRSLFAPFVASKPKAVTPPPSAIASSVASPIEIRPKAAVNAPELTQQEADFLQFLFGESHATGPSDPLTEFVADKIEQQLRTPQDLLNELPVMPTSVTTLVAEMNRDSFDLDTVLQVIEREPVMAVDLIKLANSLRYRRSEKDVTDLRSAFMNMGAKGLTEGVIHSYLKNFTPTHNIYYRYFGEKIWQHCQQTAVISKQLIANKEDKATAYLAGLLLNLGQMIIFQIMVDAFGYVDPDASPSSDAFKRLFKQHSVRLTFTIAKFWQLPTPILHAIAYQAKPTIAATPIALAVHDANLISQLQSLIASNQINAGEFSSRCQFNLKTRQGQTLAGSWLTEQGMSNHS